MEDIFKSAKKKLDEAIHLIHEDFSTVRTGKASPAIVENIVVNAYGGTARLKVLELSTIMAQDPHTLIVTPYDHSVLGEIQKSIMDSQVGLSPVVDENIIRITIPALTEERRQDFVKMVNQKAEQGKIMIRQIRHEAMDHAKKKAEAGGVSEDEVNRVEKEIQHAVDETIKKIDVLRDEKEAELMKI